jgi:DNA-binding GntR family transcriptional regulator
LLGQERAGEDGDLAPFPLDEFPYRVVADRLAVRIRAGEFAPDGKLPSATRIAAHYGVGAAVARHARQELMSRGLAWFKPGFGTFVT